MHTYLKTVIDHIKYFLKKNHQLYLVFVRDEMTFTLIEKTTKYKDLVQDPAFVGVISEGKNGWGGMMYLSSGGIFTSGHSSKYEVGIELKNKVFEKLNELNTPKTPEEELEARLKSHDWYYHQSDDNRYFLSGQESANKIRELMNLLPKDVADNLYNKYCPQ